MPKYSTGGGGKSVDDSCQLCGATDGRLFTTEIAGSNITVCRSCRPNASTSSSQHDDSSETKKKVKMGNTPGYTISQPNPDWVDNVDYGNKTPYLKRNYAQLFQEALADRGISIDEFADELEVAKTSLEAVRTGEATAEGITAEEIARIEAKLDISLVEQS
jgi:ribosome-binding protein aMBF1 (putative translation factor)